MWRDGAPRIVVSVWECEAMIRCAFDGCVQCCSENGVGGTECFDSWWVDVAAEAEEKAEGGLKRGLKRSLAERGERRRAL